MGPVPAPILPRPVSASTDHLAAVRETYFEHQRHAARYGWRLIRAGLACLVHAVVPSRCATVASDEVRALAGELGARRVSASRR